MKDFISKYLWFCVETIFAICSIVMVVSIYKSSEILNSSVVSDLQQTIISENVLVDYEVPLIDETSFIVKGDILEKNSIFDWKDYVEVNDSKGNSLINFVILDGHVDTSIPGKYDLQFVLNWNGISIAKVAEFYVNE